MTSVTVNKKPEEELKLWSVLPKVFYTLISTPVFHNITGINSIHIHNLKSPCDYY